MNSPFDNRFRAGVVAEKAVGLRKSFRKLANAIKHEQIITNTQISLSLIYGLLINIKPFFPVLGHVSQVEHQENCLPLTTQLK